MKSLITLPIVIFDRRRMSEDDTTSSSSSSKGTQENPYTLGEFVLLLGNGLWSGGYVSGLGYVSKDDFKETSEGLEEDYGSESASVKRYAHGFDLESHMQNEFSFMNTSASESASSSSDSSSSGSSSNGNSSDHEVDYRNIIMFHENVMFRENLMKTDNSVIAELSIFAEHPVQHVSVDVFFMSANNIVQETHPCHDITLNSAEIPIGNFAFWKKDADNHNCYLIVRIDVYGKVQEFVIS